MRQRVTSPDGSLAQSAISFLWRAAAARQVESACSCAIESCSFWYVVAAASAAACFHLYCSTKHCAAPCAFMVILLHSRTSAAFLAADLKQARVDAVTAAANQAFVQRIPVPSWASVRLLLFTAHSTHTDRVGFEPTVPLRAHRFSRPAVSTAHAPVLQARRLGSATDRVGFEPTKRLPVYTLSRRVPSAARPPIPNSSTHRRVVNTKTVPVSLRARAPRNPHPSRAYTWSLSERPLERSDG